MGNLIQKKKMKTVIMLAIGLLSAEAVQIQRHPHNRKLWAVGMNDEEVDTMEFNQVDSSSQWGVLDTCDKFHTENCQPVCNESLTRGCTEYRTHNPGNKEESQYGV